MLAIKPKILVNDPLTQLTLKMSLIGPFSSLGLSFSYLFLVLHLIGLINSSQQYPIKLSFKTSSNVLIPWEFL